MSRTYRRKSNAGTMHDWAYREYTYRIISEKTTEEINKLHSIFQSDSYDCSFKEPGPSWYRTLYTERPLRRYNKNELRKFMLNKEYEPLCEEKGKLEYWT